MKKQNIGSEFGGREGRGQIFQIIYELWRRIFLNRVRKKKKDENKKNK